MELRIKDLRRIESEIDKELAFKSRVQLDRYSEVQYKDAEEAVETSKAKIFAKLDIVKTLYSVKFQIREIVGDFNDKSGINKKSLQIAQLNNELSVLSSLSNLPITRRTTDGYGTTHKYYHTEGVSEDFIEEMRAESRRVLRKVQALKDSCAGTNAKGTGTLSEELENTLRQLGMID